ncbi:HAMP domain-containing histidine kinase [Gramella sp. KN1008]|nr:HAMP domain-containing histidine kinase [Gramella sp. KN1008]
MIFKTYQFAIIWRIALTCIAGSFSLYSFLTESYILAVISLGLALLFLFLLFQFLKSRFQQVDDFFEAVKYRDFSRMYVTDGKPPEIRKLYNGFNLVNQTIREMDSEREAQFLYLHKILEMVDIGIIAYNIQDGNVIWMNDAFRSIVDCPSFKNIKFLESRNAELHLQLFDNYYQKPTAIDLPVKKEMIKVLISSSIFKLENESYKLMVIHNIENTLNKTESDAWKKLLSVMTHEIMNSIAPINSLAGTLKEHVKASREAMTNSGMEVEDLENGLSSIEKRSQGLMKFAKTYRSLNKVTQLNIEKIGITELFKDIELLMKPSLKDEELEFIVTEKDLDLEADPYLIEQVLINLILNALQASKSNAHPRVIVKASKNTEGMLSIQIADNGPGIPEEIVDQIFVPFFTTKKNGSGIGLSLCKQIMTLHGGKIKLQPNGAKGTVASLSF